MPNYELTNSTNCDYCTNSDKCENSSFIFYSSLVKNSQSVLQSNSVFDSKSVFYSRSVFSSEFVHNAENITHSKNIIQSRIVNEGVDIIDCSQVYQCQQLRQCNQIKNSRYCVNCDMSDHLLFCQNIKSGSYLLFNIALTPEEWNVYAQQAEYFDIALSFTQWPRQDDLIVGPPHITHKFNEYYKILPEFYDWIKSLPNYNPLLMYELTMNEFFLKDIKE